MGEVTDFVRLKAAGETALVISNLSIEANFQNIPGIATAHYGAIAGRDEWRHVRHLFVTGGAMPNPDDTRAMAAQLTGRPVPAEQPARSERGILMADGSGISIEVMRYSNADLEMVRSNVADANLVQAIGRSRGVNRTAAAPVEVWVLATVVHPYPVTDLMRWSDVALNPIERMAARGAVLLSPVDAAKAYPDLFPTAEAARKAIARYFPDKPLLEGIIRECPGNSRIEVSYRPKGRGQNQRAAHVSPSRLDGFREWLEGVVGALADFQVRPVSEPECPLTDREAELIDPGAMFPKVWPSREIPIVTDLFRISGGSRLTVRMTPQAKKPLSWDDPNPDRATVIPLRFVKRVDPEEQARLFARVKERAAQGVNADLAAEMVAFVMRVLSAPPVAANDAAPTPQVRRAQSETA